MENSVKTQSGVSAYMNKTYKYGRYATILAIIIMLGVPSIICTVYGIWPSFASVAAAAGPLLALYVPTTISEQMTMIPIAGNTCYINSIMGNVMNLKFPCYLNAIDSIGATPGTEEADVMGMIAVTVSSLVTVVIIAIGLLLLTPLKPILESDTVTTATSYILPALYGSMAISAFISTSAGPYKASKKPLVAVICMIITVVLYQFIDFGSKQGYVMLGMLGVAILVSYILWKANILKLEKQD